MTSKEIKMKNPRWIGGNVLILTSAWISLFHVTDYSMPASITLLIVGIALVATARPVPGAK